METETQLYSKLVYSFRTRGSSQEASSTPDGPPKFATSFGCRFPSLGSEAALSLTANGAPYGRLDKRGLGRQLRRLREQLVPLAVRDLDDPLGLLQMRARHLPRQGRHVLKGGVSFSTLP